MPKRLAKRFPCAAEFTLAVLQCKWKASILDCLSERTRRYADLRRLAPELSDKVLSERLHELIAAGLVVKCSHTPAHRYALSQYGESLEPVLRQLACWALEHARTFEVNVEVGGRQWLADSRARAPSLEEMRAWAAATSS